MRFYSSYVERDPSMTKTMRNAYERKLVKLFRRFLKDALELVSEKRHHESRPVAFYLPDLEEALDALVKVRIEVPAKPILQGMVEEAMKAGVRRATVLLRRASVQASLNEIVVDQRVREVLYAREASLFKGVTEELLSKMKLELSDGILKGEGMSKLAKRISKTTGLSEKRARLIARTETMYAFNTASKEEFKRYGVEKVEWVAAMDERTCPKCGPLHGKKFKIGEAPDCPLHPNCRCVLIPSIEEEV